jgi:DNA-directed RNA polymerase beta subunit
VAFFSLDGLVQVPIVVVLKAMGMESDQEIVQMVGRDPIFAGILNPSLQVWTGISDTDFTDAWCRLVAKCTSPPC